MNTVFAVLAFLAVAALVVGLIRPSAIRAPSRGKAALYAGIAVVVCMIGAAATSDSAPAEQPAAAPAAAADPAAVAPAAEEPVPAPAEEAASALPSYAVAEYCESLSQFGGGSYQLKKTCEDEENAAREAIERAGPVEPRIMKYCDELAQTGGGSYQLLQTCIQEEQAAKG